MQSVELECNLCGEIKILCVAMDHQASVDQRSHDHDGQPPIDALRTVYPASVVELRSHVHVHVRASCCSCVDNLVGLYNSLYIYRL